MYQLDFLRVYCLIGLFFIGMRVTCQTPEVANQGQRLNFGFEKINKDKLPVNAKCEQKNGTYRFSMDSVNKVRGNYSLKILSVKAHEDYPLSLASASYYLSGDHLRNKEIFVTAWLKPEVVKPSFTGLWYNKMPTFSYYSGGMHLTGTSKWRKYRLVFYTDSATRELSFGAGLFGKGTVNIDHFVVYINGHFVDSSFIRRKGLTSKVITPHLILLHHGSARHFVSGSFSKKEKNNSGNYTFKNNIEIADKNRPLNHHENKDQPDKSQRPHKTIKTSYSSLNLSFEQLNKDKFPIGVKWREYGGKYQVSIDSTDKARGKYSLKLQSVTAGKGIPFVDISYQLRGDYLKNKEIMISAFLKLINVKPAFAGLWYNTSPLPFGGASRSLFPGDMDLRGTSDWRNYKLIFYTDSTTESITFGAYLIGKGNLNVDGFKVYIDGHLLNPLLINKKFLKPKSQKNKY